MKSKALFLGILAAGLALAGCGGGDSSTSSTTPGSQGSGSSSTMPGSQGSGSSSIVDSDPWEEEYDIKTVAEIIELCANYTEDHSEERYYVRGIVSNLDTKYGGMDLTDETGTIMVYGTYSADGELRYNQIAGPKPVDGDEVLLYGNLQLYKGTPEIYSGWMIDFISNAEPINPDDYEKVTLAEAHEAEKGTMLRTEGMILAHTYNAGMNKIGALIGDSTGTMYVYDNQVAAYAVGDSIEFVATKDYWILEDEQANAEKFGYEGANQLTDLTIVGEGSIDTFDYKAVAEKTTVKDLMDTDFSEDITGSLYEFAALIDKRETLTSDGKVDFTNYYIHDLDGKTGTYSYSQADGRDFSWLDPYDGQVVTLYATVLNAKMSSSGGQWRFLPVSVSDTPYQFDPSYVPELAVEYYAIPQFASRYIADPALEVVSSVDNDVVDFTGATLSYESSDPSALSFDTEDGKIVMHAHPGELKTVTITVTGSYGDYEDYVGTFETMVVSPEAMPTLTVKEAIETEPAADGTPSETILVRGIVGPSAVNQPAFYLIDETGAIAIRMASTDLFDGTFKIGDEVIVEGVRDMWGNNDTQVCVSNATIWGNLYGGDGTYPTDSFVTGLSIADLLGDEYKTPLATAAVYVLEDVKPIIYKGGWNDQLELVPGDAVPGSDGSYDTYLGMYHSGASQFSFVEPYYNQVVDVEVAICQWNTSGYKGCILSVTGSDGVKVYNQYNF